MALKLRLKLRRWVILTAGKSTLHWRMSRLTLPFHTKARRSWLEIPPPKQK